jgi:glycosyltransferase involved in cell wall biosynthesis
MKPLVTVLMPVYNGALYVQEALRSLVAQTYRHLDILVIDDGSTDDTSALIASFADPRIRLIHNGRNLGLIATLNRGLDEARGDLIARMDHDDISLPTRVERQVEFFARHPTFGICGTSYEPFGDGARALARIRSHTDPRRIRAGLLFNSTLVHPTVMLRRRAIEQHQLRYRQEAIHAEDYDFWARAADCFGIGNLSQRLLKYRVHAAQVTSHASEKQRQSASRIRQAQLEKIGIAPDDRQLRLNDFLCGYARDVSTTDAAALARECGEWLTLIDTMSRKSRRYDRWALREVLLERWAALCWLRLDPRKPTLWKLSESARLLRALMT